MSDFTEEIRKGESGDVSEDIWESDSGDNNDEKIVAGRISEFCDEIQKSDKKATERVSNFSKDRAPNDREIQKTEPEGNNEKVPDGKEQNRLLEEIESEISRAVDLSCVSSQVCY